ncbi:MAG: hypothetical protein ABUL71_03260, partial [Gemmatimonadota bacterium]
MNRRLRLPLLIVLLLLVGATEGPRLWQLLVHAPATINSPATGAALQRIGETITGWLAPGAALFGWSTLAFGLAAGAAVLIVVGALILAAWPS